MSEVKHTPGPWVDQPSKYRDGVLVVRANAPGGRILAEFGSEDEPLDEIDQANARLIAAAPELLETLKILRNTVGDLRNGFSKSVDCARWVEQFQAAADRAISKAEGRS